MAVTRTDLVDAVAAATSLGKGEVDEVLKAVQKVVTDTVVAGDQVRWTGFLTVEPVTRSARTGRNPQTGETIQIAESKSVKISAGAVLKSAVKA